MMNGIPSLQEMTSTVFIDAVIARAEKPRARGWTTPGGRAEPVPFRRPATKLVDSRSRPPATAGALARPRSSRAGGCAQGGTLWRAVDVNFFLRGSLAFSSPLARAAFRRVQEDRPVLDILRDNLPEGLLVASARGVESVGSARRQPRGSTEEHVVSGYAHPGPDEMGNWADLCSGLAAFSCIALSDMKARINPAFAKAMHDHGAIALATDLDLDYCEIVDGSMVEIASDLTRVEYLSMRSNHIGTAGAAAIARHAHRLRYLDLDGNHLCAAGAMALAPCLDQIMDINLSYNDIGNEGVAAIAPHVAHAEQVSLQINGITEDGVAALAPYLIRTRSLYLGGNSIGNDGACALAPCLREARHVTLDSCDIGTRGATMLAIHLHHARDINLAYNQIDDRGAKQLLMRFPAAKRIDLTGNPVSHDVMLKLHRSRPELQLIW